MRSQELPHNVGVPGAEGRACSGSQADGRLGAGSSVIGVGYEIDQKASTALLGTFDHATMHTPDFLAIPTAGDWDGSTTSPGDKLVHLNLIDAPSLNSYPFDFQLIYHSSRQAAWTEMQWGTASSATNGLDPDWNLSVVDRATIVQVAGADPKIRYTSGTGSLFVANLVATPPRRRARFGPSMTAIRSFASTRTWARWCSTAIDPTAP